MFALSVFSSAFCILLSLLLVAKLLEKTRGILWSLRYGSSASSHLQSILLRVRRDDLAGAKVDFAAFLEKHRLAWSPRDWILTRHLLKYRGPGRSLLINWVFRWPTLIVAGSFLMPVWLSSPAAVRTPLVTIVSVLLLVGTWVGVVQILVDRLALGYMASYFPPPVFAVELGQDVLFERLKRPRHSVVTGFINHFWIVLVCVISAYAGVYTAIQVLLPCASFDNVGPEFTMLHMLYFSVVTIATVGYGDISPMPHLLPRLVVASQILTGMALLVFLVTAFSLTLDPDEPRG